MWTVAIILAGLGATAVLLLLAISWSASPVEYHGVSFEDLQRHFSSWSKHVAERSDILVGTPEIPNLIQFRKKHYKTRPDLLVFRFRNADRSREHFPAVVAALEEHQVGFRIELTPKRRAPRAAVVELDSSDALLPSAVAHLCRVALSAIGYPEEAGVSVCCMGLAPDFDAQSRNVIPTTRGWQAGWRLGYAFGNSLRTIRDRLSL